MKVACQNCTGEYEINENRIPPAGIKIKCPQCSSLISIAKPTEAAPPPVPAPPAIPKPPPMPPSSPSDGQLRKPPQEVPLDEMPAFGSDEMPPELPPEIGPSFDTPQAPPELPPTVTSTTLRDMLLDEEDFDFSDFGESPAAPPVDLSESKSEPPQDNLFSFDSLAGSPDRDQDAPLPFDSADFLSPELPPFEDDLAQPQRSPADDFPAFEPTSMNSDATFEELPAFDSDQFLPPEDVSPREQGPEPEYESTEVASGGDGIGPGQKDEGLYHIKRSSGRTFGPFDAETVRKLLTGHKLLGNEEASLDGSTWKPLEEFAEFGDILYELDEEARIKAEEPSSEDSEADKHEVGYDFDMGSPSAEGLSAEEIERLIREEEAVLKEERLLTKEERILLEGEDEEKATPDESVTDQWEDEAEAEAEKEEEPWEKEPEAPAETKKKKRKEKKRKEKKKQVEAGEKEGSAEEEPEFRSKGRRVFGGEGMLPTSRKKKLDLRLLLSGRILWVVVGIAVLGLGLILFLTLRSPDNGVRKSSSITRNNRLESKVLEEEAREVLRRDTYRAYFAMVDKLKKAIKLNPGNLNARSLLIQTIYTLMREYGKKKQFKAMADHQKMELKKSERKSLEYHKAFIHYYLWGRKYKSALTSIQKALKLSRYDKETLYLKAVLLAARRKNQRALVIVQNILSRNKKFFKALYLRGKIEIHQGKLAKALSSFSKVVKLNPLHINSRIEIGRLYFQMRMFAKARKEMLPILNPAMPFYKESSWEQRIGVALLLGDIENAERNWTPALKRYIYVIGNTKDKQRKFLAYKALGAMMLGLKDYKKAIEYFEDGDSITPRNIELQAGLITAYLGLKASKKEQDLVNRVLGRLRRVRIHKMAVTALRRHYFNMARLYMLQGRTLQRQKGSEPEMIERAFEQALVFGKKLLKTLKPLRRNPRVLRKDRKHSPKSGSIKARPSAKTLKGGTVEKKLKPIKAKPRKTVKAQPEKPYVPTAREIDLVTQIYYYLLLYQSANNQLAKAEKTLRAAEMLMPKSSRLFFAKGSIYSMKNQMRQAEGAFQRAVSLDKYNYDALMALGWLYFKQHRYAVARKQFQIVWTHNDRYPGIDLALGSVMLRLGHNKKAEKRFARAVKRALDKAKIFLRIGITYYMSGTKYLKNAEKYIGQALRKDMLMFEANFYLGRISLDQNNYQYALSNLGVAVEREPNKYEHHFYNGIALERLGRLSDAEDSYNKALKLYLQNSSQKGIGRIYLRRGAVLFRRGMLNLAKNDLLKARSDSKNIKEIYFLLGSYYLLHKEYNKALRNFNSALRLGSRTYETFYKMALTYLATGRRGPAIQYLRRAIQADSKKADPHYNLALAYKDAGRLRGAIRHYRRFLVLNPKAPARKDIEDEIFFLRRRLGSGK